MARLRQLLAPCFVQHHWFSSVVVHRPQKPQAAVQPLFVVPPDQTAEHILRLISVLQLFADSSRASRTVLFARSTIPFSSGQCGLILRCTSPWYSSNP